MFFKKRNSNVKCFFLLFRKFLALNSAKTLWKIDASIHGLFIYHLPDLLWYPNSLKLMGKLRKPPHRKSIDDIDTLVLQRKLEVYLWTQSFYSVVLFAILLFSFTSPHESTRYYILLVNNIQQWKNVKWNKTFIV